MGMALGPIRILRHVPAMVEFGGRGGGARFWMGKVEFEQASVLAPCDVGVGAEIAGVEERVGTIAEALADQRVMHRRQRRRELAEQAPPRVEARPKRSPARLREPQVKTHVTAIVSAGLAGN